MKQWLSFISESVTRSFFDMSPCLKEHILSHKNHLRLVTVFVTGSCDCCGILLVIVLNKKNILRRQRHVKRTRSQEGYLAANRSASETTLFLLQETKYDQISPKSTNCDQTNIVFNNFTPFVFFFLEKLG